MSRDEQYQRQYNDILDAVMRNALINNADSYFGDIPTEEEISQSHSFSPEFLNSMESLLNKNRPSVQIPPFSIAEQTGTPIQQLDQSFWAEWKQQAANDPSSPLAVSTAQPEQTKIGMTQSAVRQRRKTRSKSRKLRLPVKIAVIAAIAVICVASGFHLTGKGFLRASRTPNVIEYEGQGTLITNMSENDYDLVFRNPTFIPEGYESTSVYKTDYMKVLEYSNGSKILRISYTFLKEDPDAHCDNERHLVEKKNIQLKDKYDAILSVSDQPDAVHILSWENGLVKYQIYGYESQEALIQIAENIMP